MKNILITGGSGFVGMHLTNLLKANGYEVSWLTRKINTNIDIPQYLIPIHKKTHSKKKKIIFPNARVHCKLQHLCI